MDTYVFTESELREVVPLTAEDIPAIAEGFAKLAAGEVEQPPILRVDVPEHRGELDVKAAHVRGWDSFAVKMSTGFFGNPERGLPTGFGLMVLVSAETGVTQAVLLDNGYLTRIRTALAGALAAHALARPDASRIGLIGAGDQARWQLRAVAMVREIEQVRVWARRREPAQQYADEMSAELGVPVEVADSAEAVVAASDIVVTTTPAQEPIIRAGWLHPGLHVTAMGSDAEAKQELEGAVLRRADLIVCDTEEQSRRLGELRSLRADADETAGVEAVELGSIVAGDHPGRESDEQITICDLTGTGVQDTVIARLAFARARERGLGTAVRAQR